MSDHLPRESPHCIYSGEQNSGVGIIVAVFGSTRPFGGEPSLANFTICSRSCGWMTAGFSGTSACPAPSLMTCCPASERGSPSRTPTTGALSQLRSACPSVFDYETLKSKWKNLRDTFVRNTSRQRPPSGSGATKQKEWKYYHCMTFLLPYIQPRMTRSNLDDYSHTNEFACEEQDDDGENKDREHSTDEGERGSEREYTMTGDEQENATSGPRRGGQIKKRRSAAQVATSELYKFLQQPMPHEDPDELFLLSLAPEMRKITVNKGQLKVKLMSLIVNWEEEQHQMPRPMSTNQFAPQYHVEPHNYMLNHTHSLPNHPNFSAAPSQHSWGNLHS